MTILGAATRQSTCIFSSLFISAYVAKNSSTRYP
jgi:hypothetical protein